MASWDVLERRVRELEQKVRERLDKRQRDVQGTVDVPVQRIYLRDGKTGSIAVVDYDSASGTLRVEKVR